MTVTRKRTRPPADIRPLLKAFYSQVSTGILITDTRGTILSANRFVCILTGYGEKELVGRTPSILASGRHSAPFYEAMWDSVRSAGFWQGEIWNRRKNGEIFLCWLNITAIRDAKGKTVNYTGVLMELSSRTQSESDLQKLRYYDPLTELPNRFLFQDRLHHAIQRAMRNSHFVVVMFMDLDDFKFINESLNHTEGDALLRLIARQLDSCIRKGETFARMGGDEFAVVLADIPDADHAVKGATAAAQRIAQALTRPLRMDGSDFFVTASIGVSVFPEDAANGPDLIKNAEAAMYHAKQHGKGTYEFYATHMNARVKERLTLINKLHTSLERNEFQLYFQPQINIGNNRITGVETLLRWTSRDLGPVSPAQFIPLLEESRLILPVGRWVLEDALTQYKEWKDAGIVLNRIAVNLSARQFEEPDLVSVVSEAIARSGVPASALELEITESTIMQQHEKAAATLTALKKTGVTISIDDFGTGYSSMSYLKRFPIDRLKVDRTFVKDIPGDADDTAITIAVIAMAHGLNLQVIAEGVETVEQLDFLKSHRCEEVQGFLFSKPLPADQITGFLAKGVCILPPGA